MPVEPGLVGEIQAKVDLLAYVSQYVTLRKRGREYVGLCPFHSEKTPSFSLNAEKQVWHCYGCDAGGDLIKFVQRYENVDFLSALRMLAARAGVTIDESPDARRRRSEREAIYEANAVAQAHFAARLRADAGARQYLHRRGIADETAEKFGIGYADDAWDGCVAALRKAGVDLGLAERAGLVRARPQGDGYYDFFRDRLMLPIYNLTGEVIAFGGRTLGDETPKYINTSNTSAYTKGRHVYALNLARRAASSEGALIVVEGYLDAIALHQAGFTNAVASLGTAFTPEQARELRRVATNIFLCFDGDAAGVAATSRSIDMLAEEGLSVEVVALPAGQDPDEFVRENGRDAFAAQLRSSVPWKEFKLESAFRRSEAKFASKPELVKEMMAIVGQERDPIVRDQYVKTIARRLDVSESALRRTENAPSRVLPRDAAARIAASQPRAPLAPSPERDLVQLLLTRPPLIGAAVKHVTHREFEDARLAGVYEKLVQNRAELEAGLNPLTVFSDDSMSDELARLALATPPLSLADDEARLDRLLSRFERRRMERRLSQVDEEIKTLLNDGASVPETLRDEFNSLAASLHGYDTSGKGV
jgi:DNA primase